MIRKASITDLDALCAIEHDVFSYDQLSRKQFRYLLTKGKTYICVYVLEAKLVGYGLVFTPKHPRPARLYSLAVTQHARHKGIGRHLLQHILEECQHLHYSDIILEVQSHNTKAIALYEDMGFKISGIRQGYYSDGSDAYKMKKHAILAA